MLEKSRWKVLGRYWFLSYITIVSPCLALDENLGWITFYNKATKVMCGLFRNMKTYAKSFDGGTVWFAVEEKNYRDACPEEIAKKATPITFSSKNEFRNATIGDWMCKEQELHH